MTINGSGGIQTERVTLHAPVGGLPAYREEYVPSWSLDRSERRWLRDNGWVYAARRAASGEIMRGWWSRR